MTGPDSTIVEDQGSAESPSRRATFGTGTPFGAPHRARGAPTDTLRWRSAHWRASARAPAIDSAWTIDSPSQMNSESLPDPIANFAKRSRVIGVFERL